jgi:ADP-ribose pyrophosphatase YjhB (NUDIX family)
VECASCGFIHYANPVPAVAALVVDEAGRILLARRAREPDAGKWDTLGGFLDEGEEPLAGLQRELLEEAGVEVEVGDFFGAFVDRYGDAADAPAILNLAWDVRITRGELAPADDVSELRWFPRDALPSDRQLAFNWLGPCLRAWAAGVDG